MVTSSPQLSFHHVECHNNDIIVESVFHNKKQIENIIDEKSPTTLSLRVKQRNMLGESY